MNVLELFPHIIQKLKKDDGIGNDFQLTETIAWLVFLKVLDLQENSLEEESQVTGETFKRAINDEIEWSCWTDTKDGLTGDELIKFINETLFEKLKKVEGDSPRAEVVRSVFQHVTLFNKSGYILKDCIDLINQVIKISDSIFIDLRKCYEHLVKNMTFNSKNHHRFYTSRVLCGLLVNLLKPSLGCSVYDPACGSGGFFIASMHYMRSLASTPEHIKAINEETFFGRDKNSLQFILGVINCYLWGITKPNLERSNTLGMNIKQLSDEDKYDFIFCNPTFDSDEGAMVQNNFPVQTLSVELMFLQHIERSLKQNGKAAVILPEGVFFNTGTTYQEVKKRLIEKVNLKAVISLPQIGVKTSIMIFDKTKTSDKVWFYRFITPEGVKLTKKKGFKKEYFADLIEKYDEMVESENSKLIPISEVISNDYNLSVNNYIEQDSEEDFLLEPTEYIEQIDALLDKTKISLIKLKEEFQG